MDNDWPSGLRAVRSPGLAMLLALCAGTAAADEANAVADLARRHECMSCHGVDKRSSADQLGPPFLAIAERYRGNAAARDKLIRSISQGSKAEWGAETLGVPMPPYLGRLTPQEIARLADWVLGLKAPRT